MGDVRQEMDKYLCSKINEGTEEEITVQGYRYSQNKTILYVVINILTFGLVFILQYTFSRASPIKTTNTKCSLENASKLCIKDKVGDEYIRNVIGFKENDQEEMVRTVSMKSLDQNKEEPKNDLKEVHKPYFKFKRIKYIWNPILNEFEMLKFSIPSTNNLKGLKESETENLLKLYGMNSITVAIVPIYKLIIDTITTPLYMYQIFITSVWMIQRYYSFASCVIFMSIISITLYVHETRKVIYEPFKQPFLM